MKKNLALLVVCVLVLFSVLGCNDNHDSQDYIDPDALVIMGKRTDMEKNYMKKIFERYKSVTGNKIYILEIEDENFEKEAVKRFNSSDGVPDIFFHFHNDDLNRLNVSENFYYMDDEIWVNDLTQSAKNYCSDSEGHILGLPFWESSVSGCYYNKKLLGSLDPAHTQNGFDVLCRTLKNMGITPICWPANGCSWMYQFGLDPLFADAPEGAKRLRQLNSDEISYADIPEVTNMVKWIKDAAVSGWFGDDYLNCGWDDISETLSSGKAAMTFIWDTWFYTDFKDGKYKKEDFALMPIFMGTANEGTYEGGNLNMMMLNKNSSKFEEAKNFISFCATAENYNYAFDGVPTVSCFKGQTTNIQSHMVTDPSTAASIAEKERVSTASTKIAGYSADDVASAFRILLSGGTVTGCVKLMDEYRLARKN